jgi:hypothetical protein
MTLKCKKNENFFCKENENFFSEVTKKINTVFPADVPGKTRENKGEP